MVYYGDDDTTGSDVDAEHIAWNPEILSTGITEVNGTYSENNVSVSITITGINVEPDYIGSVTFDFTNAKKDYDIGSTWDDSSTGVVATGTYKVNTGTTINISSSEIIYSGFDNSQVGTQTITVSYVNIKSEVFTDSYTINLVSETLQKKEIWTLVNDASTLKAGDKLVLASNSKGLTASNTIDSDAMGVITSTFTNDYSTITSLGSGSAELTLGGKSGAWTLTNDDNKLLGATAAKNVCWGKGATTWTISINSSSGATVQSATNSYGRFLHNVDNARFTTYTSKTSTSMLLPQLYRRSIETHEASLVLVNTVKSIYNDSYLNCDTNGINSTIKWDNIATLFATNVTDADELAFLKEALSDSTASNGTIKKFLADYDYILRKYNASPYFKGYSDFLGRNVTSLNASNKIYKSTDSNTAIIIIVVVTLTSVTAIGGYLFIRKCKHC